MCELVYVKVVLPEAREGHWKPWSFGVTGSCELRCMSAGNQARAL